MMQNSVVGSGRGRGCRPLLRGRRGHRSERRRRRGANGATTAAAAAGVVVLRALQLAMIRRRGWGGRCGRQQRRGWRPQMDSGTGRRRRRRVWRRGRPGRQREGRSGGGAGRHERGRGRSARRWGRGRRLRGPVHGEARQTGGSQRRQTRDQSRGRDGGRREGARHLDRRGAQPQAGRRIREAMLLTQQRRWRGDGSRLTKQKYLYLKQHTSLNDILPYFRTNKLD